MPRDVPLLVVSLLAAALLVALVSVWKRYADFRADHDRRLKQARDESVRLSRSALLGNAVEQIVPIAPDFCDRFSPSDARFPGAPVDYVIFDGLHRGQVDRVVFLEVKSGSRASLNRNERESAGRSTTGASSSRSSLSPPRIVEDAGSNEVGDRAGSDPQGGGENHRPARPAVRATAVGLSSGRRPRPGE